MTWDKEALKTEIESLPDTSIINWSDIARRYNITNKRGRLANNGGQIVKGWVVSNGVDLQRFQKRKNDDDDVLHVRRKKRRGLGGELSLPCHQPSEKVKEKLKTEIAAGVYNPGELVVPRKCEKLVLTNASL